MDIAVVPPSPNLFQQQFGKLTLPRGVFLKGSDALLPPQRQLADFRSIPSKTLFGKIAEGGTRYTPTTIKAIFKDWKEGQEGVMIILPHDDDAVLSIGITVAKLVQEKIPVRIIVTTDGRNGFADPNLEKTIVKIRKKETIASFAELGINKKQITFLGFPDANLSLYVGKRPAQAGDPSFCGDTGLEPAFTSVIREGVSLNGKIFPATRIMTVSARDYHLDHKRVAEEIPISIFHAIGGTWGQLGKEPKNCPHLYTFCVYCPFVKDENPNIIVRGCAEDLELKISATEKYQSQKKQIRSMITRLHREGSVELIREEAFFLFSAFEYQHLFKPA